MAPPALLIIAWHGIFDGAVDAAGGGGHVTGVTGRISARVCWQRRISTESGRRPAQRR